MSVIVKITGGLGNQLFQYATGLALAKKLETEVVIDTSVFKKYAKHVYNLGYLHTPPPTRSESAIRLETILRPLSKKTAHSFFNGWSQLVPPIYTEDSFVYDPQFQQLTQPVKLIGYFQSEKYFKDYRSHILDKMRLNTQHFSTNQIEQVQRSNIGVSLHVRRGDYTLARTQKVHGLIPISYYKKAYTHLASKIDKHQVFAFSDDPQWVKQTFDFIPNLQVIEGDRLHPHQDLYLMSLCSHHIIANSSFSWWGAWLAQNPNQIVIAPKRWFAQKELQNDDIYCKNWVRL